jgi:hypothetical protein
MENLRVQICHSDEDGIPEIANKAATTDENEYPRGFIVVASLGEKAVGAVAVGPCDMNDRVAEIRDGELGQAGITDGDREVIAKALVQAAAERTLLLEDGLVAFSSGLPPEIAKAIPRGAIMHNGDAIPEQVKNLL